MLLKITVSSVLGPHFEDSPYFIWHSCIAIEHLAQSMLLRNSHSYFLLGRPLNSGIPWSHRIHVWKSNGCPPMDPAVAERICGGWWLAGGSSHGSIYVKAISLLEKIHNSTIGDFWATESIRGMIYQVRGTFCTFRHLFHGSILLISHEIHRRFRPVCGATSRSAGREEVTPACFFFVSGVQDFLGGKMWNIRGASSGKKFHDFHTLNRGNMLSSARRMVWNAISYLVDHQ